MKLTSQEEGSHGFQPLDEDLNGQSTRSSKDGVFTIDTLKSEIACGVVVSMYTCVYVSLSDIMQKVLLPGRCEPVKMCDLDNTAKGREVVMNTCCWV